MSDIAREIAIRHCQGESELPLSAHSRAVWIDSLTDAIRAALASTKEQCAMAVDATVKDHDEDTPGGWCAANAARYAAAVIRSLQITGEGK